MTKQEKEFDKQLKKSVQIQNFQKTRSICERLVVGNIASDEWLYFDVLKSLGDDFDYGSLDKQANEYVYGE